MEYAASAKVINEQFSPKKFLVQIGGDFYAFQVDGSKTVKAETPCNPPGTVLYKYQWVKQNAPDWNKYKKA